MYGLSYIHLYQKNSWSNFKLTLVEALSLNFTLENKLLRGKENNIVI